VRSLVRRIFDVDYAVCGGDALPGDFDLDDFCEVLQGKVPEVEIVPVSDPESLAFNRDPSLVSEAIFNEALGEYCHR